MAKIIDKKVKITLVCDVYYNNDLLKKGDTLELSQEELNKFAKSFFILLDK